MRNITSYPLDVPYHTSAAATDPAHSLRVPQPTLRFERVLLSLLFLTFMYTYGCIPDLVRYTPPGIGTGYSFFNATELFDTRCLPLQPFRQD